MSRHPGILDGTPLARAHDAFHDASIGYIAGTNERADKWHRIAWTHLLRAGDSHPDSVYFFREVACAIGLARMAAGRDRTQSREELYSAPWSPEIMSTVRSVVSG